MKKRDALYAASAEDKSSRARVLHNKSGCELSQANASAAMSTVAVTEFEDLWPSCAAVFDGG